MVIQVAKAELRNLFYSPVAWFMLVVFMVLCAYFYTTPLFIKANWQDIILRNKPGTTAITDGSLTRQLFVGEDGFFTHVLQNLYLIIPLLTMGLIEGKYRAAPSNYCIHLLLRSVRSCWANIWLS